MTSFLLGAAMGVVAAFLFGPENKRMETAKWDIVDEASAESFPASDSPAY